MFLPHCMLCSRNSLMSSHRSSDGDKLTPSQTYSSSRGPMSLDVRQHHHNLLTQHHNNHNDDDDKLLDVVGPPHSPLLSSLQQMQSQAQGKLLYKLEERMAHSLLHLWVGCISHSLFFLVRVCTMHTQLVRTQPGFSPAELIHVFSNACGD